METNKPNVEMATPYDMTQDAWFCGQSGMFPDDCNRHADTSDAASFLHEVAANRPSQPDLSQKFMIAKSEIEQCLLRAGWAFVPVITPLSEPIRTGMSNLQEMTMCNSAAVNCANSEHASALNHRGTFQKQQPRADQ